ncbi:hypothetical protein JHK87_031404 [Glycine soja]|nr:hypothetical protein JHK87_031404 [Glycine soja]
MQALEKLYLSSNMLSGSIHSFVTNLTAILVLYMDTNYIWGTIPFPSRSSGMPYLGFLRLHNNHLIGNILPTFGYLGMVNHLKVVNDSLQLRSTIEDVQVVTFGVLTRISGLLFCLQAEKVKFQLRLGPSKPLYNAFKAIQESPNWQTLSDACKRLVESQIKEAVLNGVSLEDDKRESFNKIEQELEKLSQRFGGNVLDATKKFEKLITDKKEIEGLPATALGLAA